jgi:hypothetical protein
MPSAVVGDDLSSLFAPVPASVAPVSLPTVVSPSRPVTYIGFDTPVEGALADQIQLADRSSVPIDVILEEMQHGGTSASNAPAL